jgi:hypothetical protein
MSKDASIKVSRETRNSFKKWCGSNDETYESGLGSLLAHYDQCTIDSKRMDTVDHDRPSNDFLDQELDSVDRNILSKLDSPKQYSQLALSSGKSEKEVEKRIENLMDKEMVTHFDEYLGMYVVTYEGRQNMAESERRSIFN